jgi:hypothetical protein
LTSSVRLSGRPVSVLTGDERSLCPKRAKIRRHGCPPGAGVQIEPPRWRPCVGFGARSRRALLPCRVVGAVGRTARSLGGESIAVPSSKTRRRRTSARTPRCLVTTRVCNAPRVRAPKPARTVARLPTDAAARSTVGAVAPVSRVAAATPARPASVAAVRSAFRRHAPIRASLHSVVSRPTDAAD